MGDVPLIDAPAGVDEDAWNNAIAMIREFCGWHVAPVVTEEVTVEGGAGILFLPSLRVSEVASVIDEHGTEITSYRARNGAFLVGPFVPCHDYTVTMTHGHASMPASILSVAEALAVVGSLGVLNQVTAGPFNFSTPSGSESGALSSMQKNALSLYQIPGRP